MLTVQQRAVEGRPFLVVLFNYETYLLFRVVLSCGGCFGRRQSVSETTVEPEGSQLYRDKALMQGAEGKKDFS